MKSHKYSSSIVGSIIAPLMLAYTWNLKKELKKRIIKLKLLVRCIPILFFVQGFSGNLAFGQNWMPVGSPSPMDREIHALAVSDNTIYVGGDFYPFIPNIGRFWYIAKWDGTSWSTLGQGLDGGVNALAIVGNDLYVGGSFKHAGGVPAVGIAKWDGTSWSALGSGTPYSVYAIAASDSTIYVAGQFATADGVVVHNIAKWDGTGWSALGSGTNGTIYALAVSGDTVYAGGEFTTAGDVQANYIAKWDGEKWSALGSGMTEHVTSLALDGPVLYAGGNFISTGDGLRVNYIAKWDGEKWSALGKGMNPEYYPPSYVRALAVRGGILYAAGNFVEAGEVTVNRVAMWDGNKWFSLGSGLGTDGTYPYYPRVLALAMNNSGLYAGGLISLAGEEPAYQIALWRIFSFSGFNSPVDNPPIVNNAKAGSVIPVKWRIADYDGTSISDPASFNRLESFGVGCESFSSYPNDAVEEQSAGALGLQYLGDGNWQFNWKTSKSYAKQCRIMVLKLSDGSSHTAKFKFK